MLCKANHEDPVKIDGILTTLGHMSWIKHKPPTFLRGSFLCRKDYFSCWMGANISSTVAAVTVINVKARRSASTAHTFQKTEFVPPPCALCDGSQQHFTCPPKIVKCVTTLLILMQRRHCAATSVLRWHLCYQYSSPASWGENSFIRN